MKNITILVVDDNTDFLEGIIRNLKTKFKSQEILPASNGEKALEILKKNNVGVMLTDHKMPGMTGHELLLKGLEIRPELCVVIITGHGTVESAVSALKEGAWDFITKPVDRPTLFHVVERAMEHYRLSAENRRLQSIIESMQAEPAWEQWGSPAMNQLQEKAAAVAVTDYTVLITGESGSGKEHIARILHRLSKRKDATCHILNCPAIPEPLLESELFGHVKGSFTGADRTRDGFFMTADKGTLILDEIGDISPGIQAKLLKFLQDKEVKPVGSSISRTTDVRIIALTNQDLEAKIAQGSFRQDLYYRLNVLSLTVPPLRERKEDVAILVRRFLQRTCQEMEMDPVDIDPSVLGHLSAQSWPGNVRELLNYVRRLVVFSNGRKVDMALIHQVEGNPMGENIGPAADSISAPGHATYKEAKQAVMDQFTKSYLTQVLEQTHGNISEASRISGLERASIQKIIKRLDLDISGFRDTAR